MIYITKGDEDRRCQSCGTSGLDAKVHDIHIGIKANVTSCIALCKDCRKALARYIIEDKENS